MREGDKCLVETKDHKRNSKGKNIVVLRTSEGYFRGFQGEKSAVIRFFRENGTHLDQVVLVSRIRPVPPNP
jgi:hypothetical protein